MADLDNTARHGTGGRGKASGAQPENARVGRIAQRNTLPMRKASTLPDLTRLENLGDDSTPLDQAPPGTANNPGTANALGAAASSEVAAAPETADEQEPKPDTAALSVRPPEQDVTRRTSQREEAVAVRRGLSRTLQTMVAVFFPVMVLAAAVRAVTSPVFLWLEYHRPGFPTDNFGFTVEDRTTYASYTIDYILNWAPARYLGGLVTDSADPLFLESEVAHMADVKAVLAGGFALGLAMFVLSLVAGAYLARNHKGGVRRALFAGAAFTTVLITALAVAAAVSWEAFFTQVHSVFFADGTWTFSTSDTLIRLFPEQFWVDGALAVGVLVLGATVLTLVFAWPTRARRTRAQLAQEELLARRRTALEASS